MEIRSGIPSSFVSSLRHAGAIVSQRRPAKRASTTDKSPNRLPFGNRENGSLCVRNWRGEGGCRQAGMRTTMRIARGTRLFPRAKPAIPSPALGRTTSTSAHRSGVNSTDGHRLLFQPLGPGGVQGDCGHTAPPPPPRPSPVHGATDLITKSDKKIEEYQSVRIGSIQTQ